MKKKAVKKKAVFVGNPLCEDMLAIKLLAFNAKFFKFSKKYLRVNKKLKITVEILK